MAYDAIAVTNETFLRNISYIDLKSKPNCARQIDVGALSAEEVTERMQSVMYGYWTGPIHAETIGLYRARKGDIDPWLDPGSPSRNFGILRQRRSIDVADLTR
jgi:hypothetical protein